MSTAVAIAEFRSGLSHRRAALHAHRRMVRELATYSNPAERLDLQASLERYPAEQTSEIRTILSRQAG